MAIITLPYVYVPGQVLPAAQLNADFQTIYNDYNGNITSANLSPSAGVLLSQLSLNPGSAAINKQTTGNITWGSGLTGDTQPRVTMTSDGELEFGVGGTTAPDVGFIHSATNTVQLNNGTLNTGTGYLDMNYGAFTNAPIGLTPGGRLYMTTGSPYADGSAAATVYYGPATNNALLINNGTAYILQTFAQVSFSVGALATGMYDVYIKSASLTTIGTPSTAAWGGLNTPPTRSTDSFGRLTKNGDTTSLLVGVVYVDGSAHTTDTASSRNVGNLYNQISKPMFAQVGTNNWTYSGTWRGSHGDTTDGSGRFSIVTVLANSSVTATFSSASGSTGATTPGQNSIGINSTTSPYNSVVLGPGTTAHTSVTVNVAAPLTAGYNYIQMLEQPLAGINTAYFVGNAADSTTGCVSWMSGLGYC